MDLRHEVPLTRALSRSVLVALAQAPGTLLLIALLTLWTALCASLPGLIPFMGVGVPLLGTRHLVDRFMQRDDDLLAQVARADPCLPRRTSLLCETTAYSLSTHNLVTQL